MAEIPLNQPETLQYMASPNLRFFRWWAALLLLITLAMGPFMVFTFGAVTFGALFALTVRDMKKGNRQSADSVNAFTMFLTVIWFVYNLSLEMIAAHPKQMPELYLGIMGLAFLYPPLIMHGAYLEERPHLPPSRYWMPAVHVVYFLSILGAAISALRGFGYLKEWFGPMIMQLQVLMSMLFIFAVSYCILITIKTGRKRDRRERAYRKWNIIMFTLTVFVFVVLLSLLYQSFQEMRFFSRFMVISRSLPLCFLFVGTYYQKRFTFFDVFIKRGTYLFLLFVLLMGYFVLIAPILERSPISSIKPWFFAIALLPFLLALPWCYRRLDSWFDRAWLGRIYSTVEAVKFFLNGIQDATTEAELVKHAEERLSEIFQAGATISPDSEHGAERTSAPAVLEVLILDHGHRVGVIRMGPRPNDTPYFSADVTLLGSLADVFASLLENVRLQQKKQEQEKKEQELMLHASRSELKALRAQINPHFLFNALNAIAGLIHKDPSRAEETVEELAEVFRYTLKRSEKEWVRLEDELDFVRSYLEVEQARFGERLVVRLEIDEEVKQDTVPTMMVQTLVENAIKHGVASVRGTGIVEIRARRRTGFTRIEVLDNGPGFRSEDALGEEQKNRSGYGLRNLLQRLNAQYGPSAELKISRHVARAMTVVSVELPVSRSPILKELEST